MQWAINAYLLALAALFAFGGWLADTAGHRRMRPDSSGADVLLGQPLHLLSKLDRF
jgi:MFS family permease